MTLNSLLSHWRADPDIATNIIEWHEIPPQAAQTTRFPPDLHPSLVMALEAQGINSLYIHQSSCWEEVKAGRHVVVVTSTASGKTLCYNLPVLDQLLRDQQARALYLFPTKALAQDQLSGLQQLLPDKVIKPRVTPTIQCSVYDGDTPIEQRSKIRSSARIVISNPDMLHMGILPHHTNWAEFFSNLRFVVIDEMHTYRGVFGSHVANVIRRLKRITRFYGAYPRFIFTSATIANPQQLAEWLVEEPVSLIDWDGSARGKRHFLIYNPPITEKSLGLRRSSLQECIRLTEDLLSQQVQTIIFGRTRRSVELMLMYLQDRVKTLPTQVTLGKSEPVDEAVRGYRSGYLPRQRRSIEQGLRQGLVRAVVATTALELGIDIGGMDAAVLAGYPGTIASTWQQAGRAGRGVKTALAILVTSPNPLDQFLANHPEYFFSRSPEAARINPNNLLILLNHLRCAAFELPFTTDESFGNVLPEKLAEFFDYMCQEGLLHHSGNKYFWMADRYPAEGVSLRSASPDRVVLQVEDGGSIRTIGEVDIPSANWMVHPGAIYLQEGRMFHVDTLDLDQKIARLRPTDVDYYTEDRSETKVQLIEKLRDAEVVGGSKGLGEILVTNKVIGYRKVRWYTHETLGFGELSLPPSELQTVGYWLVLGDETVDELREKNLWTNNQNDYGPGWKHLCEQVRLRDEYRCQVCGIRESNRAHDVHHKMPFRSFTNLEQANQLANLLTLCQTCHNRVESTVRIRSGLSGLAFVLINLAPLFLMCDLRDLGVLADPQSSLSEGKPAVVIYDQVPAGIGFSERLYEIHDDLLKTAYGLVNTCPCYDGCPSCVGPGGENGSGGKRETFAILKIFTRMKNTGSIHNC